MPNSPSGIEWSSHTGLGPSMSRTAAVTVTGMSVTVGPDVAGGVDNAEETDQRRPLAELFRDLRTSSAGLAGREAVRRLAVYGPNQLTRRAGRRWPRELLDQFTQPLAILLAVAAVLAWVGGHQLCRLLSSS